MPADDLSRQVRMAARAMGRAGLAHAYGHCSARLDAGRFMVSPPCPPGLTPPGAPCAVLDIDGPLPAGTLGEVRLHRRLYATRPSVGGVVRFMGPNVMAAAATGCLPAIRHGFGCYLAPAVGWWDDPQLVRDDDRAAGAIDAMYGAPALLMRGNGAVVAGATLPEALTLAFYLEDACRIELAARASGLTDAAPIDPQDAAARATRAGGIIERMWQLLTAGDLETDQSQQIGTNA